MEDLNLHEHLEVDHGDVTTYVNVFTLDRGLIQVIVGKYDNSEKIQYNKEEFFFTQDKFKEFVDFFAKIKEKL